MTSLIKGTGPGNDERIPVPASQGAGRWEGLSASDYASDGRLHADRQVDEEEPRTLAWSVPAPCVVLRDRTFIRADRASLRIAARS